MSGKNRFLPAETQPCPIGDSGSASGGGDGRREGHGGELGWGIRPGTSFSTLSTG